MHPISIVHSKKGHGIVVDRLSEFEPNSNRFIVMLGVVFDEHPQPAVHYHDPAELIAEDVLDTPSDAYEDDGTEYAEEGEEE